MSEKYNRYKNKKSGTKEDLFSQKKFKHVEFIDDKTERENNYSTDITHNNIKDDEKEINDRESVIIPSEDEQQTTKKKNDTEIAKEVIAGKWGNGEERVKRLTAAGYNASAVQKEVDRLLKG